MPIRKRLTNMVAQRIADEGRRERAQARLETRRQARGEPHRLTLFHRPDDPYSHLLLQAVDRLLAQYDVELDTRIVAEPEPGAAPEPDRLAAWAARDCAELAAYCGLELPEGGVLPDPALVPRAEAIVAAGAGTGMLAEVQTVYAALWAGSGQALDNLAQRMGAVTREETATVMARNAKRQRRLGHYLPATVHYGGDWYWGLDRLHYLEARLTALGANRAKPPKPVVDPTPGAGTPLGLRPSAAEPAPLEMFFSFRSPYSYIALERLPDIVARWPVTLHLRPVLPMVMRGLPVPMAKRRYILRDAKREADRHGVPFGQVYDPLGPGIERCMALFPLAAREGKALDFVRSVGRGAWAEGCDIGDRTTLRGLCERAGLDGTAADAAMRDESWREAAEANRAALTELGLWGVPSFRCGDFSAWGQDRLWMLEDKLDAATDAEARSARR